MAAKAKKVNGDGSVYPKGQGYEAAISVDGARRTERAPTRAEAEAALRRLRAQRDTGTLPRRGTTTTAEFLAMWLEQAQPLLRFSTWKRYAELCRLHAMPLIGKIPLVQLRVLDLQDLYGKKLREGLSPRTVLHLHRVLHKALADAESWELVDKNVARRAKPPKVRDVPPDVLTPAQVKVLLGAVQEHPFGALFILAVTTGVRLGEVLGLRWTDIDVTPGGRASIRQTWQRGADGPVMGQPKTEQSRRDVEILTVAREALLRHRRSQAAQRLASDSAWLKPDLVFTDERGQVLNPDRVRRQFRALLAACDLPPMPLKNLRHTFATLHLDTGVSDKTVSEAMGHSRPSTTNTYYRRLNRTHHQAAAARLEALLDEDCGPGVAGGVAGSPPVAEPGPA